MKTPKQQKDLSYYYQHREETLKKRRERYYQNKELHLVRVHEYHRKNRDKILAHHKEYYQKNKTRILAWSIEYSRNKRAKLKKLIFNHYGNFCKCCGETHLEFLTIDHIDGGGGRHRKEIGSELYPWLKKNNFPEGFRTLCLNCNFSLGHFNHCPHNNL